jgi:egghead protein (zeste-white 4 protein)
MSIAGIAYGYYFSELFFASNRRPWVEAIMTILKLSWLVFLPYALVNFYSFARHPVIVRKKPGPISGILDVKLHFRFVTRGHTPGVIAKSVEHARRVLDSTLGRDQWLIEVVTDNPLELDTDDGQVEVILVPPVYYLASGTKYKARALHYALGASGAFPADWIIHLDEETQFNAETVRAIHEFVSKEHRAVALGEREYPKIGQGVVLYGTGEIVNWITTLADSIRVGDDYGRFRLQYENGKAPFGMHGSFIVVNNRVEEAIGFDHGIEGSITEDAYFALLAQTAGVEFEFIDAFMFEKSPFTLPDFIRQRHRWFSGLWLCALTPRIPFKERAILLSFMAFWSVSWVGIFMLYINLVFPTTTPLWLALPGGLAFAYYVTLYLVGYLRTYGWQLTAKNLLRLLAQVMLIPFFSVMEAAGIIYGLLSPCRDFYIVRK